MDFANLVSPPQWVFRSEAGKECNVHSYSLHATRLVESYFANEKSGPIEAVRALMGVMCKTKPDDPKDDNSASTQPTADDLAAFTEGDINNFSRECLENDSSLNAKKELKKAEGQSDPEFFLKVLAAKNHQQNDMMRKMLSKQMTALSGLAGSKNSALKSVVEALLSQTTDLENHYTPIARITETPLVPLVLPPNPIHESNERLRDMTEGLENLVGFGGNALQIMTGLQVAAAEFIDKFSTEAEKNSKAAKKAILVGFFAILFAVAQIVYIEFWRAPQDTTAMDAALASVLGEINVLQTALGADLASLQSTQATTAAAVADSVNSTSETNTALLQRIDLLLQQQRARDQAIVEALEAISETARNPTE
jgi:hypothetical protein